MSQCFALLINLVNLVIIIVIASSIRHNVNAEFCDFPTQHLPNWFVPKHYDIELDLDPIVNKFSGKVNILLKRIDLQRRFIILHAGPNLEIKDVQLYPFNLPTDQITGDFINSIDKTRTIPVRRICHDDRYDLLVVEFDLNAMLMQNSTIDLDSILARIHFIGFTPPGHKGLVRLNYPSSNNEPDQLYDRILYTKFERFQAHYLFPCYDEVRYRTTIVMTLMNVAPEYEANTFTAIRRKIPANNGKFNHTFMITPKTSINQYNFIISNCLERINSSQSNEDLNSDIGSLDINNNKTNDETRDIDSVGGYRLKLALYQMRNSPQQASKYSQDIISSAFYRVKTFLNVKYTRKPLRVFFIPGIDKELEINSSALLIINAEWFNHDPNVVENREETTYYVASIIERIARQWFGYLLNIESDSETWLFDGLAGWVALQLTDKICESGVSYKMLFYRNEMAKTMIADSQPNSEPLLSYAYKNTFNDWQQHETVEQQQQALTWNRLERYVDEQTFREKRGDFKLDELARVKSIAIINSYEDSCSITNFKVALEYIFKSFKWDSMQFKDFVYKLGRNCKWPPTYSVAEHLNRPGYPLIRVSIESTSQLALRQEKFLLDYANAQLVAIQAIDQQNIPAPTLTITYLFGNKSKSYQALSYHLLGPDNSFSRPNLDEHFNIRKFGSWVKLNSSGRGYYRVLYSDHMLKLLRVYGNVQLNDLDLLNLLNDALAIFKSGLRGANYLVGVMKTVSRSSNEILRDLLVESFIELTKIYPYSCTITSDLRFFASNLFSDEYLQNRFTISNLLTKQGRQARGKMYELLANYDFKPMILDALQLYRSPMLAQVHKDLHSAILTIVARYGTENEVEQLLAPYKSNGPNRNEELDRKIFISLAYSKDIHRLTETWLCLKMYNNSRLLVDFITHLFESLEGESFAVNIILPQLAELYPKLGEAYYLELLDKICTLATNPGLCNPNHATFMLVVNDLNKLSQLVNSYLNARRHRFYLQNLDINKLVF